MRTKFTHPKNVCRGAAPPAFQLENTYCRRPSTLRIARAEPPRGSL